MAVPIVPDSDVERYLDSILKKMKGEQIDALNIIPDSDVEEYLDAILDNMKDGGSGSLTDLDSIAFGNDPTLPSEGKTDPANYEAIADAINTTKARGNAVTVESLYVNENGTINAQAGTAWNKVMVDVSPNLESLGIITNNGDYYPSGGYDGFSDFVVSVPNSYTADDEGKVVMDSGGIYDLQPQTTRSNIIIVNGTYDTTLNNSVTVEVPGYSAFATFSGTLANPWGDLTFEEVRNAVAPFSLAIRALPGITYDATAIGAGTGIGVLRVNGNNLMANGAYITSSASSAYTMIWDANGLVSAYMEQNGTITDISQYASLITTTIYLPTEGGNT